MDILEFFTNFSSICDKESSTICFTGSQYQALFFEKLLEHIESSIGQSVKRLSIDGDLAEIQIQLSTSFLGQQRWFYLGNIEHISSAKRKEAFIKFVKTYQGPHKLIAFIASDIKSSESASLTVCTLQDAYTYEQIKKIPMLYQQDSFEQIAYFFNKLYRYKKEYSLDQLCLLKEYALLLGKNMELFFQTWIEQLIISDVSLFYLSQLFFEKNAAEFFVMWSKVRSYYSEQFWTAFFSEQLFKAYFYVQHQGQVPADQKALQFGLPFSFFKHDWKLYELEELKSAHAKIYEIDLVLKQGGHVYYLDTFIAAFFNGSFA